MKLLLFAICFFAAADLCRADNDIIGSPTEFHPQKFDVLRYAATLDFTKAPSPEMSGVCTASLRWLDSTNLIYRFHLRGLTIDSAFMDDIRVAPQFVADSLNTVSHYEVIPTLPIKAGDTSRLLIYYHGVMTAEPGGAYAWGGVLSRQGTLYAMGVGFTAPYVSTTQHWLPCYDHPSDKATFHASFLVPKGYFAASNGVLTRLVEGDTAIYEWEHDIPCATYLLTFAVDKYVPLNFSASVPAVVYSKPADTNSTRISFSRLPEMIACFENRFIPYPFEKVGYVNTPTGAMEHQTMISFNTSLSQSKNTINSVAAHELAHQWFGDLVSPLDFRHVWLTESFATFCEALWADCADVSGGYLKDMSDKLSRYLNSVAKSEGVIPIYDFPRKSPSSNYPETIYLKGAVVLGMLRYELGDSLFFGGLREYLTRHKYSVAATSDMKLVLEQISGKDLSQFFKQWIEMPGWPILTIDTASISIGNNLKNLKIHIKQTQPTSYGIYENVPIEFGFKQQKDGNYIYRMVNLSDTEQTFTLDSLPNFTAVTINEGPTVRALLQVTRITDVEEQNSSSKQTQLHVLPNPFSGSITVIFSTYSPNTAISVISPEGKTVFSEHYETDLGENTIAVPLPNLANGTYFVRVETGNERYSEPIILQR